MEIENLHNRSTAPTPEFLAKINAAVSAAVQYAVAQVSILGPTLTAKQSAAIETAALLKGQAVFAKSTKKSKKSK